MNFLSFKFRLKRLIKQIIQNPSDIFKIFNVSKVYKALKQLTNSDVAFKNLKKDYQNEVLLSTFKKLNLISEKLFLKENFLFEETNIIELKKKHENNTECQNLINLFNKYGSDKSKSLLVHIYFEIFNNYKIKSLFEIGIGSTDLKIKSNMGIDGKPGASLRAFRDYLNIEIYGADIDKNALFNEDKIKTFFIDQLDVSSIENLKNNMKKMDLIIDDGLHQPDANLNVILEFVEQLNPSGILVIEDIESCFEDIFETVERIFSIKKDYKTSLIKMLNGKYCLLIQKI